MHCEHTSAQEAGDIFQASFSLTNDDIDNYFMISRDYEFDIPGVGACGIECPMKDWFEQTDYVECQISQTEAIFKTDKNQINLTFKLNEDEFKEMCRVLDSILWEAGKLTIK